MPQVPTSPRFPSRPRGGFTFAEHPDRAAPEARIIRRADLDPDTLRVLAMPAYRDDPEAIQLDRLSPWLASAIDRDGRKHAVLTDGWRHIRIGVEAGSLADAETVLLHYQLAGLASAQRQILPPRRLLASCRHGRFARSLFPPDPPIARGLLALRVHDALAAGASQREIAAALFGAERITLDWGHRSDSTRSRVRRLVRDARWLASGGYRFLLAK